MLLHYLPEVQHTSPFSGLEAHAEVSIRNKEEAEKVYFYLRHNFWEKRIWPRFSARPDLERSLTKTKKELQQSPIIFVDLHTVCLTSIYYRVLEIKNWDAAAQCWALLLVLIICSWCCCLAYDEHVNKWAQTPYGNGESPNVNFSSASPFSYGESPYGNGDCIFCHPIIHATKNLAEK